jgi:hypothetical protein
MGHPSYTSNVKHVISMLLYCICIYKLTERARQDSAHACLRGHACTDDTHACHMERMHPSIHVYTCIPSHLGCTYPM